MATNLCQNRVLSKRGMTLIEVIVVTALFTILMLSVMNTVVLLYRSNAYSLAQASEIESARRGMSKLVQDTREMTYADNGAFPLVIMQPNKIGFYSDIDRDHSVEYVEYTYIAASTTLVKSIYNATGNPANYNFTTPDEVDTLSTFVQNVGMGTSTFYYYNATGTALTNSSDIADVRFVRAQIIVNVDPIRDPGQFLIIGSSALRNLN